MPLARTRLNDAGNEHKDEQLHLSIPTYKDETTSVGEGFAAEIEMSPKPLGAWWLRFFYVSQQGIKFEYMRAR